MSNGNVKTFTPRVVGPSEPLPQPEEPRLPQYNYNIKVWQEGEDGSLTQYVNEKRGHLIITGTNVVILDEKSELLWACPNNDALISVERVDADKTA